LARRFGSLLSLLLRLPELRRQLGDLHVGCRTFRLSLGELRL
jgi:hypothetical protein